MMKTKTLVTTVALAGAILAGASTAKANAFLELISGSTTVIVPTLANNGVYVGSVGSWTVDITSGTSALLTIQLQSQNNGLASAGLEAIYSSGAYALGGSYTFGASDAGNNTLPAVAKGFYSTSLYTGSGSLGTPLAGSPVNLPAGVSGSSFTSGSLSGNYYITEELIFGNPTAGSISPAKSEIVQADVSFHGAGAVVPDGGMTLSMIGSVMVGLVGLRSKFSKLS